MGRNLTGKVIKVIDDYKIVINKGSADGVAETDRFLVYYLGEEMIDPDTKENLGVLEIVCGEGKPEHIQERITTLVTRKQKTTKTKTVVKHNAFSALYGSTEETYDPEVTMIPFEDVQEGCLFKQIN